jgi:transposase InsO family protein
MFSLLTFLIRAVFNLVKSKKHLLLQACLYKKEIEILKRQNQRKRLNIQYSDRLIFSILNRIGNIKDILTIVKPETVLLWQKLMIKRFWTYKSKNRTGRPPVKKEIKQIILNMKNDNLNWGYKKIQGELLKLGISLDQKTIRNILNVFRRRGKVKKSLSWKKFLKLQIHSIYAMDFFTIDTILNQRLYVYFILYHKTREIVQFAITTNPTREFVRQQLIEFEQKVNQVVYMIHDHAAQFNINYIEYGIKSIKTSVEAPNMNAIAERFVGSVRQEVLDFYILINEKQIQRILDEYISYYNSKRPHQGLDQRIPMKYKPHLYGKVQKLPILDLEIRIKN